MDKRINVVALDASIQKLASSFHSGNSVLDNFLKGSLALNKSFGKTFVWLSKENTAIIGYYNLGLGYIEQNDSGHISKMGGAVHINYFALDTHFHGNLQYYAEDGIKVNLSDILLQYCLEMIEEIRDKYAGFSFISLSSTREGYNLYQRNGFDDLEEDMHFYAEEGDVECIPMFLPMDII